MKNPFLFAAGVDEATMNRCSSSERSKYITLGTLIYVPLATSIIAVIFAARYFTQNPITIFFVCLLWGGVVFTIERALIASLRPHKFNFAVLFRVVSAFAMSMIISELLVMFAFHDHIDEHVAIHVEKEIKEIHERYEGKIAELQEGLKSYEDDLSRQEQSLIGEIEGISGSMRRGDGKVAAEKRNALDRKKALFEEEKLRVSNEVASLRQQEEQAIGSCNSRRVAGLLGSIVGLHQLSSTNKTVFWALVLAHVFFLTIELMPLVIKMSFRGTQYYDLISMDENQHLEVAKQMSDLITNNDQFSCIAETLLKSAQTVTDLEKQAQETVAEDKLQQLKEQLDALYHKMLHSVEVESAA
ncbi:MAG: DUF4407 domain-containing protein [Bacteroidales bacterium]|nr:DUF4407 domain-containing protein [Bacteroidales bacterium]